MSRNLSDGRSLPLASYLVKNKKQATSAQCWAFSGYKGCPQVSGGRAFTPSTKTGPPWERSGRGPWETVPTAGWQVKDGLLPAAQHKARAIPTRHEMPLVRSQLGCWPVGQEAGQDSKAGNCLHLFPPRMGRVDNASVWLRLESWGRVSPNLRLLVPALGSEKGVGEVKSEGGSLQSLHWQINTLKKVTEFQ